ncbi:hypothetical protein OC861_007064 [Tilletia horrida]|nr:hypothetical protein OC861_007064 [Tilletia horrida]
MEEHLSNLSALADDLNVIGPEVPDEELALTMLGSLPESYATIITALHASQAKPTSEFVQVKILGSMH